jgi:hypothetical protein
MKVILFLTFLLVLPMVLATPSFNIQNEAIQPGETILGIIEIENGSFGKEIESSDVSFFQGRKEVFFEYDILYYEGTHYFYAYAVAEGNFTIKISNILYSEEGVLKSINLEKEASIKSVPIFDEETNETYTQILQIKPGFIFGAEESKITVTNIGSKTLSLTNKGEEVSLEVLETKELTSDRKGEVSYFEISSYKDFRVPAINPFYNGSLVIQKDLDLRAGVKSLELQLTRNEVVEEIVEFYNLGDGNITDVTFTSHATFIEFEGFDSLAGREIKNMSILFSPENLGNFKVEMVVSYFQYNETHNFAIPIEGVVLPKGENLSTIVIEEETCQELGGSVCSENQICTGEPKFTKGAVYCCIGECTEVEPPKSKGGNYGVIIGVLILLGLAGVGYYFYKRSKKFGPKGATEKIKETSKKFETRMKPGKSKRIVGGLDRV